MFPKKLPSVLAFGGMIAAAWMPTASAGSRSAVEDKAVFAPVESIRYEFGSKSISGYFVEQAGACSVMLMVSQTADPTSRRRLRPRAFVSYCCRGRSPVSIARKVAR
jgi:hypothetical protein